MAIDKKLIHFNTWNKFISQGVGNEANITTPTSGSEETRDAIYGQIRGTSIVFIKDVGKIWTHGRLYGENTESSGIPFERVYWSVNEDLTEEQLTNNIRVFERLCEEDKSFKVLLDETSVEVFPQTINHNDDGSISNIELLVKELFASSNESNKYFNLLFELKPNGTTVYKESYQAEFFTTTKINELLDVKQDTLVSGTNISTINGQSLLDGGNIEIAAENGIPIYVPLEENQELTPEQLEANINAYVAFTESEIIPKAYLNDVPAYELIFLGVVTSDIKIVSFAVKIYWDIFDSGDQCIVLKFSLCQDGTIVPGKSYSNTYVTRKTVTDLLTNKQDKLVSGTNIATINNQSLLEGGNITIESGTDITVDSELSEESENPVQNKVITQIITDIENRLSELTNYDDTTIKKSVQDLQTALDSLINGNTTEAIDSINEILAFLSTIADTETLAGMFANLQELVTPLYINIGINFPQATTSGTFSELNVTSTEVFEAAQNKKAIWIVDSLGTAYQCTVAITKEGDSNGVTIKAFTHTSDGSLATIAIMFVENSSVAIWRSNYTAVQEKLESGTNIKTINGDSILGEGDILLNASPEIYIGTEMPTDENIVVWYDTGSEEVIANSNSYVIIPGNVENLNKAIEAYQNSVSGYPNVENYPSLYYCDEELGSISPILHMVVNSGMVMLTYSVGSKTFMVCLNAETAEINNLFTTIIDFGDYIDLTGTDQETIASLYEGMLMKGEFVCEHPDGNKYTTLSIEKGPYESGQDLNLPLNLKIRLITADDKLETWEITREGVCTMLSSKSIGDDIIIDTEMLDDSENIVQNKIIKTYIDEKLSALESDLKEYINQAINDAITAVLNTEV